MKNSIQLFCVAHYVLFFDQFIYKCLNLLPSVKRSVCRRGIYDAQCTSRETRNRSCACGRVCLPLPLHPRLRLPSVFALLTYLPETRRRYGSHVLDRRRRRFAVWNKPSPRYAWLSGLVEYELAWFSSFNRCCVFEDTVLRMVDRSVSRLVLLSREIEVNRIFFECNFQSNSLISMEKRYWYNWLIFINFTLSCEMLYYL